MKKVWTDELLIEVVRRLRRGETVSQIAASLGHERCQLYRVLKKRGVPLPRGRGWNQTLFLPKDRAVRAYIAGILDGEGSIMFVKPTQRWQAKVGMTDEPVIRWLASFGGTVQLGSTPPPRKPTWTWAVARRRDLEHLLKATLPYLQVKREKALTAIAWCENDIGCHRRAS